MVILEAQHVLARALWRPLLIPDTSWHKQWTVCTDAIAGAAIACVILGQRLLSDAAPHAAAVVQQTCGAVPPRRTCMYAPRVLLHSRWLRWVLLMRAGGSPGASAHGLVPHAKVVLVAQVWEASCAGCAEPAGPV